MKRLISMLLLCILFFLAIGLSHGMAEDTPQLYYLWDIPFGLSESEFIEQAYAKTGFNFLPHSGEVEDSFEITTDEKQSISFLDYPLVRASAFFQRNADGNLGYTIIYLVFDVESKTIPEVLSLFASIRLMLQEKYDDPSFSALSSSNGMLLTSDALKNGFDAQRVADILVTDDTIHKVWVFWKNLGVGLAKTSYTDVAMALFASSFIQEVPESLEVYENRNKPSDAGL